MKHMLKPKLLALSVFMMMAVSLFAQEVIVSGTVTGADSGQPLEGVSVRVKNTTTGTATNDKGQFSIKAPSSESVLSFTYVGYAVYEIKAGASGSITVSLTKANNQLDEVVVIGYGTKKKVNVIGAVAHIRSEDIQDIPVGNIGQALINRLPGVGVSVASGKPGASVNINIRGASIFAGASLVGATADPLFVIDGLIASKEDFDNLDASLIEDINFLKDASAAIYGAAGAKGVVLVTTKKGRPGKPKISYSGYFGISDEAVKPQIMSAYEHAKLLNNGYELTGAPTAQRFSQADLDFLATNPYKSWYDEMWKASSQMRHTLNVSGGSDRITFFAGGNYFRQDGNYGGILSQKYGFRMGTNVKIADGLSANVIFASDFSKDNRNTLKGANDESDDLSIRAIYLTPKWVPMSINGVPVGWSGVNPPGNWNPNALFSSGNYKRNDGQGMNINASLEYKPTFLKGLTARFQYGRNSRTSAGKEYFPPYRVGNFIRGGQNGLLYTDVLNASTPMQTVSNSDQLAEGSDVSNSNQMVATLSYGFKTNTSDFDVMVGFDQSESNNRNIYIYKNGQLVNGVDQFWAFSNTGQTIRNPQYSESVKRSFIGRMNYSFMDKYMVEIIARYDASANFPPQNRWGLFPSIGLGWKISEENFFQRTFPFIDFMKIRANYGLVGEDRVANRLWQARFTQTTGMLFGSVVTNGLDPNLSPNPNITWEKARTFNAGFDVNVMRSKLTFAYDFFHRYNYDGFDRLDAGVLPPTTGVATAVVNYGQSVSWGHEFMVGYRGKITKDLNYTADINFGFSNSRLIRSYFNPARLGTYGPDGLSITQGLDPRQYNSSNFGYISKGILRTQDDVDALLSKNPNYLIGGQKPQVGFMDFEDVNGDGRIDDRDITVMYNRTTPVVAFGMTFGVSYRAFKLQMNMNLRLGGKVFYDSEARKVPTTTQNAPSFWNDTWSFDNPNAQFPRADAPLARENSTFWAVSGTQSRINNMVLSYSFPKSISQKLGIPEFRAFFTGTNLWNIVNPLKYKDPYTSNFASYPTLRTISLGVNATL
ncbi:MAG: SusC/RagA family TonB-linked outer membrane protein [Chitinophagaceae bacterium]|nr:SusC/RagA family TonB-linked outer membrane protein [Chitinophagaceae bacterium]